MVGSQIRFAFHTVDNQEVSLLAVGNRQFDVSGERCAAHTHNASVFNLADDVFGVVFDFGHKRVRAVDGLEPFVAFNVDIDGGFLESSHVNGQIHLRHRSRNRRVDVGRNKAVGLANQLAHFHLVALLNNGVGGRANVLRQRYHGRFGQLCTYYCFGG